ncbi:MAG TPA: isochorismate synthase [Lentisphaeria bacterium]|nr:isochorismate synthase [Lentisphaeria bacterium]
MDLVQEPVQEKFQLAEKIQQLLTSNGDKAAAGPSLVRVTVDIRPTDPLTWLAVQPHDVKTYWCDRERRLEIAGVGIAAQEPTSTDTSEMLQRLRSQLTTDNGTRWLGGFSFDGRDATQNDTDWEWYGRGRFIVPRFEVIAENGVQHLACNLRCDSNGLTFDDIQSALNDLDAIRHPAATADMRLPAVLTRDDTPGLKDWTHNVEAALEAISRGHFDKVVLARQTIFHLDGSLAAPALLHGLREDTHHCFLFCFQPRRDIAFFGATPELLYRRIGRQLTCEAIAGTQPRGESQNEDLTLGRELLASEKDRREHRFVAEHIRERLVLLGESTDFDEPTLLRLASIQHLQQHFDTGLGAEVSDADILAALHPTPAVGGSPRNTALSWIKEFEPFCRGAYAAPVGWIDRDNAEFAVGIRSALYQNDALSLFAGAGIVDGSVAAREWAELDSKIETFRRLLAAPY